MASSSALNTISTQNAWLVQSVQNKGAWQMGSDPQSNLQVMDEMVHRECEARIKALEGELALERQARISADTRAQAAYTPRAEKAEGAIERIRSAIVAVFGGMGKGSAIWGNSPWDKGWTAGIRAALTAFDTERIAAYNAVEEGALKVAAAHNLELQEENDRLKARIAELEEDLRPFASEATEYPKASDRLLMEESDAITIGDLRRAARALEGKKSE